MVGEEGYSLQLWLGEWVLHLVRGGERTLPIVRVGGMSTPYSQWWEKRGTPYS